MNRRLNIFMSLALVISMTMMGNFKVFANQSGDYTYTVIDGNAQITGYMGVRGDITIPDTIDGYEVTSIGDQAFSSNRFNECQYLTSIIIPQSVTSIGYYAFLGCNSISSIILPQELKSIGDQAFWGCSSLTSINIPKGVSSRFYLTFAMCYTLTNITVDENNLCYKSINGVLYNKEGTTLILCPPGLTTINIPQGVNSIGEEAFYMCDRLVTVTLPQGFTSLGAGAFNGCINLTTINLPDGLTNIGGGAFNSCWGLTTISLPQTVTNIGTQAFLNCKNFTNIIIPQGVKNVGYEAFHLSGLLTIRFNSPTTTISDYLDTFPANVKIIGYDPSTAKDYATQYGRQFEKFSDAKIINIGDYVQMGKYYDEPILWRCVDIDSNGPLMLADH